MNISNGCRHGDVLKNFSNNFLCSGRENEDYSRFIVKTGLPKMVKITANIKNKYVYPKNLESSQFSYQNMKITIIFSRGMIFFDFQTVYGI